MYIRTNRKVCLNKKGFRAFGFDFNKEKIIYKFEAGFKLSKSEYKALDRKFYSYSDWKKYVQDKYNSIQITELEEFEHYLLQRKGNNKTGNNVAMACSSVLLAAITSIFIDKYDELIFIYKELNGVVLIVVGLGIMLFYTMIFAFIFNKLIEPYYKDNEENIFYDDYIAVVQELIGAKKKKFDKD